MLQHHDRGPATGEDAACNEEHRLETAHDSGAVAERVQAVAVAVQPAQHRIESAERLIDPEEAADQRQIADAACEEPERDAAEIPRRSSFALGQQEPDQRRKEERENE